MESGRIESIGVHIIEGRQVGRALKPGHRGKRALDVVRGDARPAGDLAPRHTDGAEALRLHVPHDADRGAGQWLAALRPGRVPRAHRVEVIRNTADEQALMEVDAFQIDLAIADINVEAEKPQVQSGRQDAHVALEALAAFQHERRFGEALDRRRPDGDGARAQLVLQAERDRDALIPGVVARAEMVLESPLSDRTDPMAAKDPACEPWKAAKADEDKIVARLQVVA